MAVMFGRYRLESLVARGGMGEVYHAFDTHRDRDVAIKLLSASLADETEFRQRFRRESRAAGRLQNPNIIPIYDFDEHQGRLYIVMPLVRGRDLGRIVAEDGPLPPERAARIVEQIADALDAAHDAGVVHRDVKPSNILVTPRDHAYLVDFGIARVEGAGIPSITLTGTVLGTPDFMAPEMFLADPVDRRTDVYALGCVLFFCLTGGPPFSGATLDAVRDGHLHRPRPSIVDPVAGVFDDVVKTAMAVDAGDRHASAGALSLAVWGVLHPAGPPPSPSSGGGAEQPTAPGPGPGPGPGPEDWWPDPATDPSPVAGPAPALTAPPVAESPMFSWNDPSPTPPTPPTPPTESLPFDDWWEPGGPMHPEPSYRPTPEPPEHSPAAEPQVWQQGRFTGVHAMGVGHLRIGRAPDNDVVVDDLLVSRHHAELRPDLDGWCLVDLASASGTFVNGARVDSQLIGDGDVVGVGHTLLHFDGDRLVEYADVGHAPFQAEGLTVRAGHRVLLDEVSFALPEPTFLAVIGPSGAGKSTLLRALTGFRPANEGHVRYAGRDLYEDYDELRHRIGYVPQDDIQHPELTVEQALRYAAELRFGPDVSRADRERRVGDVIDELDLQGQRHQRIGYVDGPVGLSGGQRKRTSTAMELLTRPSLLVLDEPTSGLDPRLDRDVMVSLRRLADDGQTVVVSTHSVLQLDLCDRLLVLAEGGSVAYFGPPEGALAFFGAADFVEMFARLDDRSIDWKQRYRASADHARYVDLQPARPAVGHRVQPPPPPPRQTPSRQFGILSRRYLTVIAADRAYALFLVALPFVLAGLLLVVPSDAGLSVAEQLRTPGSRGGPHLFLLVLLLAGAFMGFATAFRELVKERAVFRREQGIGVSLGAYLASKLVVLGTVTGLQGVVLATLGLVIAKRAPDSSALGNAPVEVVVAAVAVTVSMAALGLLVSACIRTAEQGMPVLVVVLMLQMVMAGFLFRVDEFPVALAGWLVVTRWGLAMAASTTGLDQILNPDDALWANDPVVWLGDLTALVGFGLACAVGTALLLRRLRPGPRPGRRR